MSRRLVVPKSARSEVWNYFGFEANESGVITDVFRRTVWCRLCDTQLLFSGNTTNLSAHIARCKKMPRNQSSQLTTVSLPVPVSTPFQKVSYTEVRCQQNYESFQPQEDVAREEVVDYERKAIENDQQYCLKWKHHHSNQLTMFAKLLEQESFCDVTIACEEKLIRAHKLVLSACSSYFELVLSHYEDRSPIIILKDVKHEDMEALMQFMYLGEINIAQSQLPSLLETAELLKIKGLTDMYNQISDPVDSTVLTEDTSNNETQEEQYKRPLQEEEEVQRPVKIIRQSVAVETCSSETADMPSEQRQDNEGVIRLPDFLREHGNYQDYWKKPWVVKALQAVSNKQMTLRHCSDLLGVGYNMLYSRYRLLHGSLKENPRSYTLKVLNKSAGNIIVRRDSTEIDQGGKIVLRRDQISPSSAVLRSVVNVKVESNMKEQFEQDRVNSETLEPIVSMVQNGSELTALNQ